MNETKQVANEYGKTDKDGKWIWNAPNQTPEQRWADPQIVAVHNMAVIRSKAGWTHRQELQAITDAKKGIKYERE